MTNSTDYSGWWFMSYRFDEMKKHVDMLEKMLLIESKKSIEHWNRSVKAMPAGLQKEYSLYNEKDAGEYFPRLFYRNMLVSIWSTFEHHVLKATHEHLRDTTSAPEQAKAQMSKIRFVTEAKKYWEDQGLALFPTEWTELLEVQEVRNLIVHNNSERHLSFWGDDSEEKIWVKRSRRLEDYVDRRAKLGLKGLKFSDKNPVEFMGAELFVDASYCREVCDLCASFLKSFLTDIPKSKVEVAAAEFFGKIDGLVGSEEGTA